MTGEPRGDRGYDTLYERFESPAMQQVRREAYGTDIGQHSWVTVEELERHVASLELSPSSHLLDVGCGPGGPLTFVAGRVGCSAVGTEVSRPALALARARVAAAGLDGRVTLLEADAGEPLPAPRASFDAAMALDVVLHLPDRAAVFRDLSRVLRPGGRFVFTDASVLTGAVSVDELVLRAKHGQLQVVPAGTNERLLAEAGFKSIETRDLTDSLLRVAGGRLAARQAHRAELEALEGPEFARQLDYLATVVSLGRRGALSRLEYRAVS